jgi:hypothetical protein
MMEEIMERFACTPCIKVGLLSLILSGLLMFSNSDYVSAQKVNARVRVQLERLPLLKQKKLKDFAEEIEYYINDYDWTGESSDDEIPISIQIFLTEKSVSFEDRYAGTVLISNNSDIQYTDKYWNFPYQAEDRLMHNENVYDPFTGVLEFYMYLILGGEYDKYGKFLGTPFFEKAKHISEQAKFNNQFYYGWEEREVKIDRVLEDDYLPFRVMKDTFFLGLDYLGENDTNAKKYCFQALQQLDDILVDNPDHRDALQFVKGHHIDFIAVLKDNRDALEILVAIDPENKDTYQKYLK